MPSPSPKISLKSSINVFLTPEEVRETVAAWAALDGVHCVFSHPGREFVRFAPHWFNGPPPIQAVFDTKPFDHPALARGDLALSNPERLTFLLPKQEERGLVEGVIGTLAGSSGMQKVWRSLLRPLVGSMSDGMWAYNTLTQEWFELGCRSFCSVGAAAMHRQGVPLATHSGNFICFPERPQEAS